MQSIHTHTHTHTFRSGTTLSKEREIAQTYTAHVFPTHAHAQVFGEKGKHARAAVGVAALPLGAVVEVDAVVEFKP